MPFSGNVSRETCISEYAQKNEKFLYKIQIDFVTIFCYLIGMDNTTSTFKGGFNMERTIKKTIYDKYDTQVVDINVLEFDYNEGYSICYVIAINKKHEVFNYFLKYDCTTDDVFVYHHAQMH